MSSEVPSELTSEQTLQALEDAINLHFKTLWLEGGVQGGTDYIQDWVVIVASQDLSDEDGPMTEYSCETRERMAPHAIRGLLEEGLDWLADRRMSDQD